MRQLVERRTALLLMLPLVFTYLFFIEYLPPIKYVHIPYDLPLYHYPLADYAFQALSEGRFPAWDPTIYAGMPLAANPQAALFYPPTWILFLANAGRAHLSFQSLQHFVFLHVCLAFILCYLWLSARLSRTAALFGSGVFAYSGLLMMQLQHLGVAAGYAWMPLGFAAIDDAYEQRRFRPLSKLTLASAMAFLAGYTPFWFVFAISLVCYALFRKQPSRTLVGVLAAIAISLLIAAVQLLPAAEASSLMERENRYGDGIKDPQFYLSFLIPNLHRFGISVDPGTNPGREYLYLGAPAIAGLLFFAALRRRDQPERLRALPLIGALFISAIFLTNPFDLIARAVEPSSLLSAICRDWYFLAGLSLPIAALAALGIDRFLRRPAKPWPRWTAWAFASVVIVWSLLGLWLWLPGGGELADGWPSALDAAVQLALFAAGVFLLRCNSGPARVLLLGALVFSTGVDYKIHGTSKRFNAERHPSAWVHGKFESLDPAIFEQISAGQPARAALDVTGPFPQLLRHVGLTTPQGFDPFFTSAYKSLLKELGADFYSNWQFLLHPANVEALRILGVRYFITAETGPLYPELAGHPRFKLMEPATRFYKVFESLDAAPPYGWENSAADQVRVLTWQPEHRSFTFDAAPVARTFYLSEQWAPGWTAGAGGTDLRIERWRGALQSVSVPPGASRIDFVYRPRALTLGAAISVCSIAAVVLLLRRKPR